MERELIELFEAVKKAADGAVGDGGSDSLPEEDRCIDALKRLKKFPVNYQVLVSTQVGKRLRHLTKHPRKKIQALASDLVEVWKNIIIEETTKSRKNGVLESRDSMNVESKAPEVSDTKYVQAMKIEKDPKVETMKLERNDQKVIQSESLSSENKVSVAKIEKNKIETIITKEEKQNFATAKSVTKSSIVGPLKLTSMVYCKDPLRDKVRDLLFEALFKVPSEIDEELRDEVDSCDPIRVSVSVESVMFDKWGKSNGAQKFKYRSIMFNIKDPNNPDFRRKVLLGLIKPEKITELTPEEMASTERQLQNVKIKEKALFNSERGAPPKATTDQFKCGRCGKKQCTYYQLQTRSADEPMTTFVTCVNCNNHWKFC